MELTTLSKFESFIKENTKDAYEIIYLGRIGTFSSHVYNIPLFHNQNLVGKIEKFIFSIRSILKFLNIKSIAPGLIFIGVKK